MLTVNQPIPTRKCTWPCRTFSLSSQAKLILSKITHANDALIITCDTVQFDYHCRPNTNNY